MIEHFRVLPTDERYLRLSEPQISVLVNYWLNSPGEEDMKRAYWEGKREDGPPVDELAALGYSPEQIEAIKAELHE